MLCEMVVGRYNVVGFELDIALVDDEVVELERDEENNMLAVVVQELQYRMFLEGHIVEVVRT